MTTWLDGTSANRAAADAIKYDKPPGSGAALPTLPDANYPEGSLFCRTSDFSLWRVAAGGASFNAITSGLAAGAVTNTEVAANAAIAESKLALTNEPNSNDPGGVIVNGTSPGINQVRGMRYTVRKTGSIVGMAVYLTATAGNWVGGIYDTTVTTLAVLASTVSTAGGTANTWQGVDFTSPLSVVRGQSIFVCVHTDNSTIAFGRTATGANTAVSGPLPANYIPDADNSQYIWWNFNRGSYSAPLAPITVASLTSNAGSFVFWLKYA